MSEGIEHVVERAVLRVAGGGMADRDAERGRGLTPFALRLRLTFLLMGVDLIAFMLAFAIINDNLIQVRVAYNQVPCPG